MCGIVRKGTDRDEVLVEGCVAGFESLGERAVAAVGVGEQGADNCQAGDKHQGLGVLQVGRHPALQIGQQPVDAGTPLPRQDCPRPRRLCL